MPPRAVIYTRVSTVEQVDNHSLEGQRDRCVAYCHAHGYEVDRVFEDRGVSAKTENRPEFQRLIAYCAESQGKLDYLLVDTINRFSRSVASEC